MTNVFAGAFRRTTNEASEAALLFDPAHGGVLLLWCRLLLYVAGFFGVIVLQIRQENFLNPQVWQPFNVIMIAVFGAQVAFAEIISRPGQARRTVQAMFLFDALVVNLIMWVFGSQNSVFLFFLLLISAGAAITLGMSAGIKTSLWSLALLNVHLSLNPWLNPEVLKASWFIDNLSVFAVAGVAGILGEQIQVVSKDIEIKREEIETLTNLNDLIVDNIPSGLLLVNEKYVITQANRGAAKIFGDLGLEGRPLSEVLLSLQNALVDHLLPGTMNSRSHQRHELEFLNYRKEKSVLEVISALVRRPSGGQFFVVLVQNVTEMKNLQFQLAQKEKLAAVGQLAAGIAHEIRNPLASISGSVQLLQANLVTQTAEDGKLFRIVIKEIDRLNNLITEFLDFVRPDVRLEDPVDINQLARDVLEMAKMNPLLSKKVQQRTELRSHQVISGHYDKLKQALLNIIINAYQAMGDTLHPELWVRSFDDENRVVLEIQDNGTGISRDNVKRVFEPFHTTKAGGTGLGLAITHKIIESHEAEIFVDSEWGHGAKFTIIFQSYHPPRDHEERLKKQA